jgi:hypothetical protein
MRVDGSVSAFGWRTCRRFFALAYLAYWLAPQNHAQAFCRESLDTPPNGVCTEEAGDVFLSWRRPCLSYVFNNEAFDRMPLLGEAAVRSIFKTSFGTWAAVDCQTGKLPFNVDQTAATTTNNKAEFLYDVPNESIINVRTQTEWAALPDHSNLAIALTLIWHDKSTGEILDVDMDLNLGAGNFADCMATLCKAGMVDLQNTVTHEAGHLLGLGHSTVPGATMAPTTALVVETTKRSLENDDDMGYCALALPAGNCNGSDCTCPTPPIYPSTRTVHSCGCRIFEAGSPAANGCALLVPLAALLGRRRWRRRAHAARHAR